MVAVRWQLWNERSVRESKRAWKEGGRMEENYDTLYGGYERFREEHGDEETTCSCARCTIRVRVAEGKRKLCAKCERHGCVAG